MAVLALAAWLAGTAFGTLPGDAISPSAAIGYALWVGLIALASGSVAWVLAPFIGRAGSAGIAGFVLIAAFLVNGYSSFVPVLGAIANLSWFSWTAGHQPLAGMTDWPSLIPVALVAIVLLALGTEAFSRRDLGASSAIATPGLPRAVLGVRGPVGRSFGERLPTALAWGIGLGVFGFVIAAASGSLADAFKDLSPDTHGDLQQRLPERRHHERRRLPPDRLHRARVHHRRVRGGDARRRLGLGRDVRPAGDAHRDATRTGAAGRSGAGSASTWPSRS